MDGNGDGSVDKEEYANFAKQEIEGRFTRKDLSADGKVTLDEFMQTNNRREVSGGQPGEGAARRPGAGDGGVRRAPGQDGPGRAEGGAGRPRSEVEGTGRREGAPPVPPARPEGSN